MTAITRREPRLHTKLLWTPLIYLSYLADQETNAIPGMFPAKPVQQVAALPFIRLGEVYQVLLITTRRRGRWSLPKGWPKKRLSPAGAAAKEALEEAGVSGRIGETSLGSYEYSKRMPQGYRIQCRVTVYPLLVTEHRLEWSEAEEREFRWVGLGEAAALVDEPGLRRVLNQLKGDSGALLGTMGMARAAVLKRPRG